MPTENCKKNRRQKVKHDLFITSNFLVLIIIFIIIIITDLSNPVKCGHVERVLNPYSS